MRVPSTKVLSHSLLNALSVALKRPSSEYLTKDFLSSSIIIEALLDRDKITSPSAIMVKILKIT